MREAVPSPVPAPSTSSDRGVPSAAEESSPTPTSAMTMEERVARAKQLLAERQAQKAMEEEDVSSNHFVTRVGFLAMSDSVKS